MIPTSIDGTDITGATIDGTDVTEITVDGQTVFSAQSLPVAFSDMIAWYPMEANIAGGDEFSDATALFSGAADSTAYDLTDDGAVYEASEGVTDINEGANSGAFENNGSGFLTSAVPIGLPITITFWYQQVTLQEQFVIGTFADSDYFYYKIDSNLGQPNWNFGNPVKQVTNGTNFGTGVYSFAAISVSSGGSATLVQNRSTTTTTSINDLGGELEILGIGDGRTSLFLGYLDDFRVYNTDLSLSDIQQIYDNTEP